MCLNCCEKVPKENIKFISGVPICSCCLEYNNINCEALKDLARVYSEKVLLNPQIREFIKQKEQEKRAEIKVIY